MCPLPIDGADASFYTRLFTASWYRGDEHLSAALAGFGRLYRVPSSVLEQIRCSVRDSGRALVSERGGEMELATASGEARGGGASS